MLKKKKKRKKERKKRKILISPSLSSLASFLLLIALQARPICALHISCDIDRYSSMSEYACFYICVYEKCEYEYWRITRRLERARNSVRYRKIRNGLRDLVECLRNDLRETSRNSIVSILSSLDRLRSLNSYLERSKSIYFTSVDRETWIVAQLCQIEIE